MLREKKGQIIDKLTEDLSQSNIIISTNYQGLPAKQMAELRNALAKTGAEYHVVRNTLTRFAADKSSKPQLMNIIEGPTALAFGHNDVINLAKVLSQYIKESPLQIRGGLLGDRILTSEEVLALASLPSKEVLISQLIGQLQAPVSSLYNVLSFPLRGSTKCITAQDSKSYLR
jgi:large subunit ribosomal protein L10